MEEHLRQSGLYVVRPDEFVSGFSSEDVQFKIIDQLIEDYTKVHPKEMHELLHENKSIREAMKDQYGSSGNGLRWGFRLPPALVRVIERRFPNFFVDRNAIHKFMERHKELCVCETI